jgi:hypothetical protein
MGLIDDAGLCTSCHGEGCERCFNRGYESYAHRLIRASSTRLDAAVIRGVVLRLEERKRGLKRDEHVCQ